MAQSPFWSPPTSNVDASELNTELYDKFLPFFRIYQYKTATFVSVEIFDPLEWYQLDIAKILDIEMSVGGADHQLKQILVYDKLETDYPKIARLLQKLNFNKFICSADSTTFHCLDPRSEGSGPKGARINFKSFADDVNNGNDCEMFITEKEASIVLTYGTPVFLSDSYEILLKFNRADLSTSRAVMSKLLNNLNAIAPFQSRKSPDINLFKTNHRLTWF